MSLRFSRLDRASIRQLGTGQAINEHGITVERLANGDLRYSVNIMVDGRRIHRVIGRESDGVTRTQAEEFIERARSKARDDRLDLPKGRKLDVPGIEKNNTPAQVQNARHVVGNKEDSSSFVANVLHLTETFILEFRITDR